MGHSGIFPGGHSRALDLDVVIEADGWADALPDLEDVAAEAAGLALSAGRVASDRPVALVLLACDDARIAALNADFRDKASATNVLSWPAFDLAPSPENGWPPPLPAPASGVAGAGDPHIGDLALALETCCREAENAGLPLKLHVRHLILHGCLHLLGFDHGTDTDAVVMEGLERQVLMESGYEDPYS